MFSDKLKIIMAQVNLKVGDFNGNVNCIIKASESARDKQADIIVFPELSLCGYPPEDLLLRPSLIEKVNTAMNQLLSIHGICMIVGLPFMTDKGLKNQAVVIKDGLVLARYSKQLLPNYQVFDEQRYFIPGDNIVIWHYKGVKIALTICEDLWQPTVTRQAIKNQADLIISINASPFHTKKNQLRQKIISQRCLEANLPILYVNLFGAQDELIFDGGSFAMNANGDIAGSCGYFQSNLVSVLFDIPNGQFIPKTLQAELNEFQQIYQALVLGVKDYVNKNNFKGVILGLSGGIDSALTLAIAVDALGKDRVQAIMMPFRYTSKMSMDDAKAQSTLLQVEYQIIPIESIFTAFTTSLQAYKGYQNSTVDTTEENLQSRCRATLLMAISNKKGYMLLTTGNKSEMAVGYATLYGDMCGGFNPLKDVSKTLVFKLANYRNSISAAIPQRVIDRPPSAELAPDQKDTDSLPEYETLDQLIELYVEKDKSSEDIIQMGFDAQIVRRVLRLIDQNEFKRRQSVIGVRITSKAFGRDRRYPITNGWLIE